MEGEEMITLVSVKDGAKVKIFNKAARLSGFLKGLLEEYQDENEIQIPEIKGNNLQYISEFLNHYKDDDPTDVSKPIAKYDISETYGKWDDEFISQFINKDKFELWELMEAASFLDCKPLLELAASKIACMVKDYSGKELMEYFGLEEDMTDDDVKKMEEKFEKEKDEEREKERLKELESQKEKEIANEPDEI
jgi:S-phase kinase-associated protein 1